MRFFFILFFSSFSLLIFGQENNFQSFELGIKDGLPASQITDGFQCSRGFIWLQTNDAGLARYDGTTIKTYTAENSALPNNYIELFLEAPDSLIWILNKLPIELEFQLSIFNPITEEVISFQKYFKEKRLFAIKDILRIQKAPDGDIYIFTKGGLIYAYNGSTFEKKGITPPSLLKSNHKVAYHYIGNSMLCIIVNIDNQPGEVIYANLSGEILDKQSVPKGSHLTFMDMAYQENQKIPSVYLKRVFLNNPNHFSLIRSIRGQQAIVIDTLRITHYSGYLGSNNILFRQQPEKIEAFNEQLELLYRIPHPQKCNIVFFDRQNGIWLTTGLGHLRRIQHNPSLFQNFGLPDDNPHETPGRGITEDLHQNILIARFGDLLYYSKKEGTITPRPEMRHGTGLYLDKKRKYIWVAYSEGLLRLDAENIDKQLFYTRNKEKKDKALHIWQPYVDRFGKVWAGSANGLFYINEQDTALYAYPNYNKYEAVLKGHTVYFFHENKAGIWVATSVGVFLLDYDKGLVQRYHTAGEGINHLAHNHIAHIHEDKDGWFWLASKGGGLIHWNPKTGEQTQFTKHNGLYDNMIYAAYSDDYGQLWLPSNYGLMRFDKKTKEAIVYLEEHGLPDLEFNTSSHYQATDGQLYFGGIHGSVGFHPRDFLPKTAIAAIELTSFQKQNNEEEIYVNNIHAILSDHTIYLNPNDKFFELSFALLNFNNLENHKYAYKIEGYDKSWQPLKNPILKINNLPYGHYKLRLRAQATGEPWQELAFPIQIQVPKPFYLQWWFLALSFGGLTVGLFGLVRWRFAALQKRKTELETIVQERTAEIAQQANELKNLDKVKSRFFANISHELRTPLTLILGPISSLQAKPFGSLEERTVRKNLDLVTRNGKNLLVLIEEVLELSKLEAAKIEIQEKATFFKPFIQRIYSSFDSLAELNNIKYHLDYNLQGDLTLLIDRQKIEKIINNLLSNAFKFTAPNHEIILELRETKHNILLILKDTGLGINKADLPYVFDRFYQSKSPELAAQGGTGIGLALCKEFVELMDGRIWVTSELGKGSQFFVEIPKKIAPITLSAEYQEILQNTATKEKTPENWVGTQKGKTLLLVEDNRDMQNFIHSLLSPDYKILKANNGLEGLEQLKIHGKEIDLIISDAMMPLMDGFSMMTAIKADDYWRSLPVIMLTARAAEEDKLQALTIGVDDYIIKPFSSAELQVRIKNLLENYENRKLWKQDLLLAAANIHSQQDIIELPKEEEEQEEGISQQDLLWMKEVEKEIKVALTDEGFDINILAQKMLLSKRQFERKIKKITGLSPAKLVTEIRMQSARDYLEKGSYQSITEVSLAVGMQTPGYFSKLYFKRFGKKVGDYFR